ESEESEELRTTLYIETNNRKFVLCNLIYGMHEQQNLNVTLSEGEDVKLYSVGHNKIHLTGNYIKLIGHDDSENRPKELPLPIKCKPNDEMDVKKVFNVSNETPKLSASEKKNAITNADDSDETVSEEGGSSDQAIVKNKVKGENGKSQKRTNDDDKDKQKTQQTSAAKKQKTENGSIETKSADVSSKAQNKKKNKNKKKLLDKLAKPKTEGNNKNAESKDKDLKLDSDSKEKGIITTPEGVQIEDLTIGVGRVAKLGKKLQVRYIGRLHMNGKVFDKNVSGTPFHFTLGKGEVIKGWEIGISGMRIGGERKITIPPQQAYGSAGSPPS
ncbi:35396_t:CDS:2, partial [Racocetra persica]